MTSRPQEAVRSAITALVDTEENRTRSRIVAYSNVAMRVGSSSSWVRKFIAASPEVSEPRASLLHRIYVAYDAMCVAIEKDNALQRRRLKKIKGELDAISAGRAFQHQHTHPALVRASRASRSKARGVTP